MHLVFLRAACKQARNIRVCQQSFLARDSDAENCRLHSARVFCKLSGPLKANSLGSAIITCLSCASAEGAVPESFLRIGGFPNGSQAFLVNVLSAQVAQVQVGAVTHHFSSSDEAHFMAQAG